MKRSQKAITCAECDTDISGSSDVEVVRKEMDHYRLYHPDLYQEMLSDVPVRQLFRWFLSQVRNETPRTA
jgi:hypothetical protein